MTEIPDELDPRLMDEAYSGEVDLPAGTPTVGGLPVEAESENEEPCVACGVPSDELDGEGYCPRCREGQDPD